MSADELTASLEALKKRGEAARRKAVELRVRAAATAPPMAQKFLSKAERYDQLAEDIATLLAKEPPAEGGR
jgi:hypothetical protein